MKKNFQTLNSYVKFLILYNATEANVEKFAVYKYFLNKNWRDILHIFLSIVDVLKKFFFKYMYTFLVIIDELYILYFLISVTSVQYLFDKKKFFFCQKKVVRK